MSIQKRTVFYEHSKDGLIRFFDYALVTTTLGTMVEPFLPNCRLAVGTQFANFDPTDETCRIDDLICENLDKHMFMLSGGGTQALHGGTNMPRVGR